MWNDQFQRKGKTRVGKVVSLNRFRNGQNMSPLRQAEAYWTALRSDQAAIDGIPRRSQIDPRGLENLLGQAFVLQRIASGMARFRLSGHNVNASFGTELRGMPLSAMFDGDSRSRIAAALEHLFDSPAIAEFALHTSSRLAATRLDARMLLLPLCDDTGIVNRALGVVVTDGVAVGTKPRRFDLDDVDLRPVLRPAKPAQPQYPEGKDQPVVSGFAEASVTLAGSNHLKLIVSRD
jgi:hypothetical protein